MGVGGANLPRRIVQSIGLDPRLEELGLRLGVWH
jgi:hypothetical protein